MKRSLLSLLALLPACSAAPVDAPIDDTPATQTGALTTLPAVPASFWTTSAPGVTPGYVALPNGDQIDQRCVQIVKPGQTPPPLPHKKGADGKPLPCPYAPIKGKTIKATLPVEPTLSHPVEPANA